MLNLHIIENLSIILYSAFHIYGFTSSDSTSYGLCSTIVPFGEDSLCINESAQIKPVLCVGGLYVCVYIYIYMYVCIYIFFFSCFFICKFGEVTLIFHSICQEQCKPKVTFIKQLHVPHRMLANILVFKYLLYFSQQPSEACSITLSILQVKKLRYREIS